MDNIPEECGTCKFWKPRSDVPHLGGGFCRRYPPSMASSFRIIGSMVSGFEIHPGDMLNDAQPNVHQQSWCGEYKPHG